jgi:hypothetical protein
MSTLKTDAIEAATGTNTDLELSGKGTGVPDIASGFKVGGTAGVPVNNLRTGTDGELITWDASGDPATVAVGTATHVLTSNGAGAAPTFQAAAGMTLETAVATTSGTEVDYTGIPSTTKRITIMFQEVSTDGNDGIRILIGDAGGLEGSGYDSVIGKMVNSANSEVARDAWEWNVTHNNATGTTVKNSGIVVLALLNSSTNLWSLSAVMADYPSTEVQAAGGSKALSAVLTQLRIEPTGSDSFDYGSVNISYE